MKIKNAVAVGALALAFGHAQAALFDRGGGLIYDDVLNVTWLSNANYTMYPTINYTSENAYLQPFSGGKTSWSNANAWVSNLSYTDIVRGVVYDDWRLPATTYRYPCTNGSCSELQSLYQRLLGPAVQQGGENWLATNHTADYDLFENIQPAFYWSSQDPQQTNDAWFVGMDNGSMNTINKGTSYLYAWAVRDGDVASVAAPIPEPETYAMMLAGLGLLGLSARRRKQNLNA